MFAQSIRLRMSRSNRLHRLRPIQLVRKQHCLEYSSSPNAIYVVVVVISNCVRLHGRWLLCESVCVCALVFYKWPRMFFLPARIYDPSVFPYQPSRDYTMASSSSNWMLHVVVKRSTIIWFVVSQFRRQQQQSRTIRQQFSVVSIPCLPVYRNTFIVPSCLCQAGHKPFR